MRYFLVFIFLFIIVLLTKFLLIDFKYNEENKSPLKIGVLYSTTGPRSINEFPIQEATLMAIQEINQLGLLERKIIPIIRDAKSSFSHTINEIEHLILSEKVEAIFGVWFSDHFEIEKLFKKHNNLLITPFPYEGYIESDNIIYIGTTAIQQVPATIEYSFNNYGKKFFLIGSDYFFSRVINLMVRDQIIAKEGEIVEEIYIPFDSTDFDTVVESIKMKQPSVILNSLMPENQNQAFYKKMREAGIQSQKIPTFSFFVSENMLANVDNLKDFVGNYSTWNYFQSINTPLNRKFVKDFALFSNIKVEDNTDESAYIGVQFWARAVQESGKTDPLSIKNTLSDMHLYAPEGAVTMDIDGQFAWRYSRIGKIQPDGQFNIVWESTRPMRPTPYQVYRSQAESKTVLESFRLKNNNKQTPIE